MVAGAAGSTVRRSSSEEGGAHNDALASSRGASAQAESTWTADDPFCAGSEADWPSAEPQSSNDTGRHEEIRARYIMFYLDRPHRGRVPACVSEIRYSRSQHELSTLALNHKVLAALPTRLAYGCAASSCRINSSVMTNRSASVSENISGGRSLMTLWCGPSVPARIPHSRSRFTT
jgi:hypothetical protein